MNLDFYEDGRPVWKTVEYNFIEKNYPELALWLKESFSYLIPQSLCEVKNHRNTIGIRLYTRENSYYINVNKEEDYLSLISSDRTTGAGNDLTDGNYSEKTWNKILRDILSNEILPLTDIKVLYK